MFVITNSELRITNYWVKVTRLRFGLEPTIMELTPTPKTRQKNKSNRVLELIGGVGADAKIIQNSRIRAFKIKTVDFRSIVIIADLKLTAVNFECANYL